MSENTVAILCSGQGQQHRDMFKTVSQAIEAESVFREASRYFRGVDPRDFIRDVPENVLFSNRVGQLLCCTQALAAWASLGAARPKRAVIAGYSVGELAAWGCAGILRPEAVLALADQRARLMDAVSPPDAGLLGVVGLHAVDMAPLLERNALSIAIENDIDSYVVGGLNSGLTAFAQQAQAIGARHVKWIHVTVPSHTPLLQAACPTFADALKCHSFHRPETGLRLLSGIDADSVVDMREGAEKLTAQIAQTLRWRDCLQACVESGAVAALELGPGDSLCRMLENHGVPLAIRAHDQFHRSDTVKKWLNSLD
jgi:[acyl-carrier-protein] S-malonyltransferase